VDAETLSLLLSKPGWALHWSRDYNADTSDADNRPAPKPLKWVGSIG